MSEVRMEDDRTVIEHAYSKVIDRLQDEITILRKQLEACQAEIQRLSAGRTT